MPFRLMNAPTSFSIFWTFSSQRTNADLPGLSERYHHLHSVFWFPCEASETSASHARPCKDAVKLKKCEFLTSKNGFYGHFIEPSRLNAHNAVVLLLREASHPKLKLLLRSVLEHCSFYRRFTRKFSKAVAPLHGLLLNDVQDTFEEFSSDGEIPCRLFSIWRPQPRTYHCHDVVERAV